MFGFAMSILRYMTKKEDSFRESSFFVLEKFNFLRYLLILMSFIRSWGVVVP